MKKHGKKIIILAVLLLVIIAGGYLAYVYVSGYVYRVMTEVQLDRMLDEGEITIEQLTPESPKDNAEPEEQKPPENVVPEPKDTAEKPPASKPKEQIVREKAAEIEKSTPQSERSEMMRLITSRLSPSDISYLTGLLKDGLTKEEKKAAKKLAYARFTPEEIKKVREYYKKYIGLIQ